MPISYDESGSRTTTLLDGTLPVPRDSGLYIQGCSAVRLGDMHHMLASRWPVEAATTGIGRWLTQSTRQTGTTFGVHHSLYG